MPQWSKYAPKRHQSVHMAGMGTYLMRGTCISRVQGHQQHHKIFSHSSSGIRGQHIIYWRHVKSWHSKRCTKTFFTSFLPEKIQTIWSTPRPPCPPGKRSTPESYFEPKAESCFEQNMKHALPQNMIHVLAQNMNQKGLDIFGVKKVELFKTKKWNYLF